MGMIVCVCACQMSVVFLCCSEYNFTLNKIEFMRTLMLKRNKITWTKIKQEKDMKGNKWIVRKRWWGRRNDVKDFFFFGWLSNVCFMMKKTSLKWNNVVCKRRLSLSSMTTKFLTKIFSGRERKNNKIRWTNECFCCVTFCCHHHPFAQHKCFVLVESS